MIHEADSQCTLFVILLSRSSLDSLNEQAQSRYAFNMAILLCVLRKWPFFVTIVKD